MSKFIEAAMTRRELELVKDTMLFLIKAGFVPPDYTNQEVLDLAVRLQNELETSSTGDMV